jgi:nitrite reductase (NO-forming)
MGTIGHQEFDDQAQRDENPNYVLINGASFYLTGEHAINVTKDSTVRIIFSVGGPNLASSFHMIGEVWDRVWYETEYTAGPNMLSAETVLVAPGSVLMVELTMEQVGSYLIVDHALSRVFDKGCLAQINVNE